MSPSVRRRTLPKNHVAASPSKTIPAVCFALASRNRLSPVATRTRNSPVLCLRFRGGKVSMCAPLLQYIPRLLAFHRTDARFRCLFGRGKHKRKPHLRPRQRPVSAQDGGKRSTSASEQLAAFAGVAQLSARAAPPTDTPDSVRPSRNAVPFPTVDVTAGLLAAWTEQEERPPAIAGQRPPHHAEKPRAVLGALQLHAINAFSPPRDKVRQTPTFPNLA